MTPDTNRAWAQERVDRIVTGVEAAEELSQNWHGGRCLENEWASPRAMIADLRPDIQEEAQRKLAYAVIVRAEIPETAGMSDRALREVPGIIGSGGDRSKGTTVPLPDSERVEHARDIVRAARELAGGEAPTAAQVRQVAHVGYNSGENEWYTPSHLIESARKVMGGIDLDPASTEVANEVVQAATFYTAADDGLAQGWRGRVWMNPPYARPLIDRFAEKLAEEYANENIEQAIALVNNATETSWFGQMAHVASAACFPSKRVKFWHPERQSAPLQGQAILYFGPDVEAFVDEFKAHGHTWVAF